MVFRDTGPLGETAKLLGIPQGSIEALFNEGTLAVFVQGKIAERNIFQAQQQLEQSFLMQREALIELQQSIPMIQSIPDPEPMMPPTTIETRQFCPIFGNTNEGV